MDDEGSRRRPASAESQRHRRQKIKKTSTQTLRGDLLRRRRKSRRITCVDRVDQDDIYTDGGVREDLLHRWTDGVKVFYIHKNKLVAFLVISNSPRCTLGLFQSGVGSAWMCLNTGRQSWWIARSCRRPKEIGKVVCRRISSRINHIDGRGPRNDHRLQRTSSRINHIDGRGSKEGSSSTGISSRINHIDGK